ncbi:methyltransferase family protein [Algoriphagus ratkowskyi]|uniref:Class I SAM-dependent methyltransferase n=1 Tax=Algoriphagus ratkowskyi TaxID=57028 RepID=A0A2W7RPR7_9BACT|nr:class I SAM-dependent methyltransferase [Algoriphagus ratkowskyi]PZX52765.1 methyltransferase family protein [Algoriphagus ratkowskyi]TXD76289.1 class I SAM-dependent methyltransferase [Algoriphagus ratkowskyi]
MENQDRKKHWEHIYQTKNFNEVSWYQQKPETSLEFLQKFNVPLDAKIIDCGGGDSCFVDNLLSLGYQDITVLDISEKALDRAIQRLGDQASKVKWIVSDATSFQPSEKYDFWHDRAVFHFLPDNEVAQYLDTIKANLNPNGHLVVGTFSVNGPTKCSGIAITQYSEESLSEKIEKYLKKIYCFTVDHLTPSKSVQNFVFCSFQNQ